MGPADATLRSDTGRGEGAHAPELRRNGGVNVSHMLPDWTVLSVFLASSFVLCVTPGPGVIYIVTRSVSQGRRAGLASVAGVAAGNLGNAILASTGLALVFAVSDIAFMAVKYAGAAYLLYLGVSMMMRGASSTPSTREPVSTHRVFGDAAVVALLNPKTTLFFAAFVPQFVQRGDSVIGGSLVLSIMFVGMAAVTDTAYALGAGAASRLLRARFDRLGRALSGSVYVGLAIAAATRGTRP